jgi:hypothetical protein
MPENFIQHTEVLEAKVRLATFSAELQLNVVEISRTMFEVSLSPPSIISHKFLN